MDKNQSPLLAVDLGGTKCSAALISPAGQILHRKQEATCQAGAQAGIEQIVRLCKEILVERERSLAQVGALGVSIAALLETSSDRVIWAPHLEGWADVPLRTLLEEQLKIPVAVEFDGHAAVLGEWWAGSGKGYHSLVNVIVGTGIGGGMILDGKLYRGANRLAGAAGWFTFFNTPEHSRERASRFGGWEAMAAGPGLVEHTIKLAKQLSGSRLYEIAQPDSLTPADIFACAEQGDQLAREILDQLAEWLGLGIANIVSLVNPQIIILGGGLGSHCQALLPRIREVMIQRAQPYAARAVNLEISKLGPDAGLYGAAYAAMQRLSTGAS